MSQLLETPTRLSVEDYLRFERGAENKHEYCLGETRVIDGMPPAHNQLCARLNGLLFGQLEGRDCTGFSSHQRVRAAGGSAYLYPDLALVCGAARFDDNPGSENLLNPTLLVEVLSKSTLDQDRGEKFMLYRQLPSLRQYLMLDSATVHAELYTRQPNDHWLFMETRDLAAVLDLSSVGCELALQRLYQGVALG